MQDRLSDLQDISQEKRSKKNGEGVGKFFRNRSSELGDVLVFVGIVAGLEFVGGGSLDHPKTDVALGSGIAGGFKLGERKYGAMYTSMACASMSLIPDTVDLTSSGDLTAFGSALGYRAITYAIGTAIGGIFGATSDS